MELGNVKRMLVAYYYVFIFPTKPFKLSFSATRVSSKVWELGGNEVYKINLFFLTVTLFELFTLTLIQSKNNLSSLNKGNRFEWANLFSPREPLR